MDFSRCKPPIALNPLDGRYARYTRPLVNWLSEPALNRERLVVETEWLVYLTDHAGDLGLDGVEPLSLDEKDYLRSIPRNFGPESVRELYDLEKRTRHDVKAIEYYCDRRLREAETTLGRSTELTRLRPLVHFCCTSEDVNNLAYARCVREAVTQIWLPALDRVIAFLNQTAHDEADVPMLAMTHGQPAMPTTLGKEAAVTAHRLKRQRRRVAGQKYLGKFNGATGVFGVHRVVLPDVDWLAISRDFVENRMGLSWNPCTTQIESHDWQAELYGAVSHTNRVCHGLCVDCWMYVSRGVFRQIPVPGATGSSTMPHKVNPISFENAEANFELSCALFDELSAALVESRWQRDLTDSTMLRNIGMAFGYSLLALTNLLRGMRSIEPDKAFLERELDAHWEVLGEPIQTVMRARSLAGDAGLDRPYERVKDALRGETASRDAIHALLERFSLPPTVRELLLSLSPRDCTGLASAIARTESQLDWKASPTPSESAGKK
ncbi:MAG: adenylosuccinate lyase [Bifidobacteriaceae bacterium]|nr:adenylosuccinate lyase [Bifidobacteriaceae bacterium]